MHGVIFNYSYCELRHPVEGRRVIVTCLKCMFNSLLRLVVYTRKETEGSDRWSEKMFVGLSPDERTRPVY